MTYAEYRAAFDAYSDARNNRVIKDEHNILFTAYVDARNNRMKAEKEAREWLAEEQALSHKIWGVRSGR